MERGSGGTGCVAKGSSIHRAMAAEVPLRQSAEEVKSQVALLAAPAETPLMLTVKAQCFALPTTRRSEAQRDGSVHA